MQSRRGQNVKETQEPVASLEPRKKVLRRKEEGSPWWKDMERSARRGAEK